MVENEDLELDFNMFEPSMSVFAELLTEKEKMQVFALLCNRLSGTIGYMYNNKYVFMQCLCCFVWKCF